MTKRVFHIRFWRTVKVKDVTDCWEYPKQGKRRYASVTIDGQKTCPAHRIAYELFFGEEIPKGMLVCHRCDNTLCCNPYHLFLGTTQDNAIDMVKKGRNPDIRGTKNPMFGKIGEKSPSCKVTVSQVLKVKEMHKTGLYFQREIAKKTGMTIPNVSAIVTGRTWSHI